MDELHLEFPFTGARMLQGLLERTGGGSIGRRSSTCDPIPTWYGWIGCTCRSCVPSPDAEKFNSAGATEAGVDYCRQCRHTLCFWNCKPDRILARTGQRLLQTGRPEQLNFLRSRSFGWGLTKMVCFWESPFERFLWLDADTSVWGDIRKKLFQQGNWDIYTDKSDGSYSREDVTEWFFDADKLEQRYPGFNWQRYAGSNYCTGIWASRRGVFPLQEYKDILNVVDEDPSLFKCAEMGLLNFMIFRAMEEGRVKVASGRPRLYAGRTGPQIPMSAMANQSKCRTIPLCSTIQFPSQ